MSKINKFLLFLIFLMSFGYLNAAHIIGGDVIYKCKFRDSINRKSTFEIVFTMYRDSRGGGANFDDMASFGLYKSSDGDTWTYVSTSRANPKDIGPVGYENPCIIVPPEIGVEKATYTFDIVLDWGTDRYQISYQRCCRNNTITNIVNPAATGAAFAVEIFPDAVTQCNNSPVFTNFPPIVICSGEPLIFDHSAFDAEGDQLVYEFCSPLASGGTDGESSQTNPGDPESCTGVRPNPSRCPPNYAQVEFKAPLFSSVNPIGGTPQVAIDPISGLITGTPNINGQYVVGVCVKEFRNGKLIGSIRRDFQFNVTTCQIAVDAIIEPDYTKITNGYIELTKVDELFKFKSCGSNFVPFVNNSIQERNIRGFKWKINNGVSIDSFISKDLEYTFTNPGIYKGQMILNPDLSNCSDTAEIEIEILPGISANFDFDYDTCVASPIQFTDLSVSGSGPIATWLWEFEKDKISDIQNPQHEYRKPGSKKVKLTVNDFNQCKNTIEKDILYQPVPALLVIEPTQFTGCVPASIFFNNISYPIDETYKLEWDFGDGSNSDKISPTHTYEKTGIYNVQLKITSPIGCTTSKTYGEWIEILDSPTADFTYSPENLNNFNKEAIFENKSINESFIIWDFAGLGTSFSDEAKYIFPDTGKYLVTLQAIHENGCVDSLSKLIDVAPIVTLVMPNAFTPNNDGLNDDYKGYGYIDGVKNYKMTIWNRWGEQIYETSNPRSGWNGQKENTGLLAPQGVYVFIVDYITPRGEPKNLRGHVTLIR